MTVRSRRLDFTLSAHLMSYVSGSHCKMMSESPRPLNIFTPHTTVDVPYRNDFTYMLKAFSPSDAAASFRTR